MKRCSNQSELGMEPQGKWPKPESSDFLVGDWVAESCNVSLGALSLSLSLSLPLSLSLTLDWGLDTTKFLSILADVSRQIRSLQENGA
jgi:hypothetical protein